MTVNVLDPFVTDAADAARSFLASLLGAAAPLDAGEAGRAAEAEIAADAVVLGGLPSSGSPFGVVLDPGWGDLFGQAMFGGPVPEEELADLLGEALGQAYGAIRTQLSASGHTLPDASFAAASPSDIDGLGIRIPFSLAQDGGPLEGAVYLSLEVIALLSDSVAADDPAGPAVAAPAAPAAAPAPPVAVSPVAFADLGAESIGDGAAPSLQVLSDVELEVTVELGRRRLPLADVLRLTTGSVVELDKMVGQPLAVFANGRLIAEGEAVVIDDQFGLRVTSLASNPRPRSAIV